MADAYNKENLGVGARGGIYITKGVFRVFFYLMQPIMMYNWILITAAIVPAIFLMIRVYKADRMEKESGYLLRSLVIGGILATLLAQVEERIGEWILYRNVMPGTTLYNVILYFVVVGVAEETSKFIMMRSRTWRNPEFNCQYDGVVYAVFVSLGFALWENISYVLTYGFSTALVRAVTAVPGHACFGVFMGIFYGIAKKHENRGHHRASVGYRALAILVPVLLHGAYDYIASMEQMHGGWFFVAFIAAMFILAFLLVNRAAKDDQYIG